jgi:anti-sigma B factor antagonist
VADAYNRHLGGGHVPLMLATRRIGDITVVTCSGRIVEGAEAAALKQLLADVVVENPRIVLNLGAVDFIDSCGLGLLVRFLSRARHADGDLVLCAVSRKMAEVLRVTRLTTTFEGHDSEAEAVRGFYRRAPSPGSPGRPVDVLCVDSSADVLAYLREVLRQAGYEVMSSDNVADGLLLLTATQPRVVVVSAELRATRHTRGAATFNRAIDASAVIELSPLFGSTDAGAAGAALLDQVRAMTARPAGPALPPYFLPSGSRRSRAPS